MANQKKSTPALPLFNLPIGAWRILILLIPVYVCTLFYRMAPAVLAHDLATSLSVPLTELSMLSGATMLSYGLMQLPSGLFADAFGGRRAVCLLTLMAGLGTLWFALASSLISASAARLLIGVGLAVTVPILTILARWFPPAIFARVSSLLLASGGIGSLLATAPLAIASDILGWRPVLLGCAVLSLSLTALVWIWVRDTPQNYQEKIESEAPSDGAKNLWQGLKLVLSTKAFWPLCITFACILSVYFNLVGLWWPPYMMDVHGLSKTATGMMLFVAGLTAMPAMPLLAAFSDRIGSRKKVLLGASILAFTVMLPLALFPGRLSLPIILLQAIAFCCACSMTAVAFASTRELFPLAVVGTASGCLNTLPCLAAAPVQKLFGMALAWRLEVNGGDQAMAYAEAFWVNIFLLAVALIAALRIRETFGETGKVLTNASDKLPGKP